MPDLNEIGDRLKRLARTRVLIGIPGDEPRGDGAFPNASRGYVFEFGSPAINMPARPHLVPGIEAVLPEITERLKAAASAAVDGGDPGPGLAAAGQAGVNSVKGMITNKLEPPIQPISYLSRQTGQLARSYRRRRAAEGKTGPVFFDKNIDPQVYARAAEEASGATPLVDTGNYRDSITFSIKKD